MAQGTETTSTTPESGSASAGASKKPLVLLVEDDIVTSSMMGQLLSHYEFEVKIAASVLEAMPLLPLAPQFAILDLTLSDGNGDRVLELIRSRKLNTKVAIVTGCRDRERLKEVIRFKPDWMFAKPLDFFKLLECLRSAA